MGNTNQRAEQVTYEDLVTFLNACFVCTSQKEYYSSLEASGVSVAFLHDYVCGNYRALYAKMLAARLNHFNQVQIILHLLSEGQGQTKQQLREEGDLIFHVLCKLPNQRVYRMFAELARRKVNNRRSRAIIRRYLLSRKQLPFEVIKYRRLMKWAVRHAHIAVEPEVGRILFEKKHRVPFQEPLFEAWRVAHYSKESVYQLPYSVAEGFAASWGLDRAQFLERISDKMTHTEKLRMQTSSRKDNVDLEFNWSKANLTSLCIYLLSLSGEERFQRRKELQTYLTHAALRIARQVPRMGRVAAVLDNSYSSIGSSEKGRRPLALALAVSQLLARCSERYLPCWVSPCTEELAVQASGNTDLVGPLLRALRFQPSLVVILSDGYENAPPLAAHQVISVFQAKLDPKKDIKFVHFNPTMSASSTHEIKRIASSVPTIGLRQAEEFFTMLGFARFVQGDASFSELEQYLQLCAQEMLSESVNHG
jgi:hypothetical protein